MNKIEEVAHIRSLFRQLHNDEAGKIKLVTQLRNIAIQNLQKVIAKVPRSLSDEAKNKYMAMAGSIDWDLTTTDAYKFFFMARDTDLTPSQQSAAALLYNCTKVIDENVLSDRLQQNILDAYAGLDLDAVDKGNMFQPGRPPGSITERVKYIHDIATQNPDKPAKILYRSADKSVIGDMPYGTFKNHVSSARNPK